MATRQWLTSHCTIKKHKYVDDEDGYNEDDNCSEDGSSDDADAWSQTNTQTYIYRERYMDIKIRPFCLRSGSSAIKQCLFTILGCFPLTRTIHTRELTLGGVFCYQMYFPYCQVAFPLLKLPSPLMRVAFTPTVSCIYPYCQLHLPLLSVANPPRR